jgi:hypothetical protein
VMFGQRDVTRHRTCGSGCLELLAALFFVHARLEHSSSQFHDYNVGLLVGIDLLAKRFVVIERLGRVTSKFLGFNVRLLSSVVVLVVGGVALD